LVAALIVAFGVEGYYHGHGETQSVARISWSCLPGQKSMDYLSYFIDQTQAMIEDIISCSTQKKGIK
jgi:hypothetical protein